MKKYELDGEVYYYNSGKWLTSNYLIAPLALVGKLNKLLVEEEDLSDKSFGELIKIIDGARDGETNIQLAVKAADLALEMAKPQSIGYILPRATSNYRKIGKPQLAIQLANKYIDKYGDDVISSALLTSMAAAYCDLGELKDARKYADRAKARSAGKSSPELVSLYTRLKRLEG